VGAHSGCDDAKLNNSRAAKAAHFISTNFSAKNLIRPLAPVKKLG